MKLLIQRVREAAVAVDGETIGQIGHGLLVFVGVADTDTKQIADKLVDKMTKLRILMMHRARPILQRQMCRESF